MVNNLLIVLVVISAIIIIGLIPWIIKMYKKPIFGKALVRTGMGGTKVQFDQGMFVIPILQQYQLMDISMKTLRISSKDVLSKDNVITEIKAQFYIRINSTVDDVKNVAFQLGCETASKQETLNELFEAKFTEAIMTVARRFDYEELHSHRQELKHDIFKIVGMDLSGFYLDDCAIDYIAKVRETNRKNNMQKNHEF